MRLVAPARADQVGRQPRVNEQPQAKKQKRVKEEIPAGEEVELRTVEGYLFKVPKYAAKWFSPTVNAKQAQQIFQANGSAGQKGFRRAFERICRNCWFAGKGPVGHTVSQCKQSGAACAMPCLRCGGLHWTQECKKK